MTETVRAIRTSQRAGEGASPVQVRSFRISLLSRSPQSILGTDAAWKVRADADPALEDTIYELKVSEHRKTACIRTEKFKYDVTGG